MSDYAKLKRLDEESLQKLQEGPGPADECLCAVFGAGAERTSLAASVKRALGLSGRKKLAAGRGNALDVPLAFRKGGPGLCSSKEAVPREAPCGRCGCDSQRLLLKHSYANIRISTPDISSFCPCSSDCLPDKEKLQNNIKVIVERASVPLQSIQTYGLQNDTKGEEERN